MASLFGLVFAIFVLLLSTIDSPVGALKEFKVGGAEGWQQPGVNDSAMYNQWAAMHRFHVGDSLREFPKFGFYFLVNYKANFLGKK